LSRRFSSVRSATSSFSATAGIGRWITFYNQQRPHTAHGGQPPAVVYFNATQTDQQVQAVA
jgi:putative transposase